MDYDFMGCASTMPPLRPRKELGIVTASSGFSRYDPADTKFSVL